MQEGSTAQKPHKLQNTVTHARGEYSAKSTNYKTQSHMQGVSTAQKAQTTKHSHKCKGGVQRKKHKLQNTVTHARGEYSAKSTNYKTQSHIQGGSTAQKAQTYKTQSHIQGGSTAQKAQTTLVRERVTLCTWQYSLFLRSIVFLSDVQWVDHH